MRIAVLLFARYSEVAGVSSIEVDVPPGATLSQVWEAVPAPLLARDQAYARAEQTVQRGDEIAAFPPVSGG